MFGLVLWKWPSMLYGRYSPFHNSFPFSGVHWEKIGNYDTRCRLGGGGGGEGVMIQCRRFYFRKIIFFLSFLKTYLLYLGSPCPMRPQWIWMEFRWMQSWIYKTLYVCWFDKWQSIPSGSHFNLAQICTGHIVIDTEVIPAVPRKGFGSADCDTIYTIYLSLCAQTLYIIFLEF